MVDEVGMFMLVLFVLEIFGMGVCLLYAMWVFWLKDKFK